MTYRFRIQNKDYTGATLADVSATYSRLRDESGEGASTFPEARVSDAAGKIIGYVSYNGRIWARTLPHQIAELLYDNRVA